MNHILTRTFIRWTQGFLWWQTKHPPQRASHLWVISQEVLQDKNVSKRVPGTLRKKLWKACGPDSPFMDVTGKIESTNGNPLYDSSTALRYTIIPLG